MGKNFGIELRRMEFFFTSLVEFHKNLFFGLLLLCFFLQNKCVLLIGFYGL